MNATMNPPQAKSITLYYREGASDKVYQCSMQPSGELFVVNFSYGRRGATLQNGTKTSSSVDYETAAEIFDKLVQGKMAKGYTPGADGTPYKQKRDAERADVRPQLLNPIEEDEVKRLITDPAWCMQEKKDGKRFLLQKQGAAIHGINKKGLLVGLPSPIVHQAQEFSTDFIIDGECVGDVLYAFDLLKLGDDGLMTKPYNQRLVLLAELLDVPFVTMIETVETAFAPAQKAILYNRLKEGRKEGVVFKRLDAPYMPGRPASGGAQLKHKFCATLSAVVATANPQRSVGIHLLDGYKWVTAGNVTIPPNHDVPQVGAVVEVKYLYAMPGSGCLYQPAYLGGRSDVGKDECTVSQLKFKGEDAGA